MRLVVADCSIDYTGRLSSHLEPARRLILVKDDGTVVVHADRGHKALNWMAPPCRIEERPDGWTVTGRGDERLEIAIAAIVSDLVVHLGDEPGLLKTGSEKEIQALLAADPGEILAGSRLVAREFETGIGPVDLLLRDDADAAVAVEVKRVAELAAVEQLTLYLERLNADASLAPVRGLLVAQTIKPQTRVLAAARGIGCVEVDFEVLAGRRVPQPTLFPT